MINFSDGRAQQRLSMPRIASLLATFLAGTMLVSLTIGSAPLLGQQPAPNQSGLVPVTVIDRLNRFVTGLDQDHFVVTENGVQRPITFFSQPEGPTALAVVADGQLPSIANLNGPGDELIQTTLVTEAVRQLTASKHPRKALIVTSAADLQGIPAGIQVLQVEPANLLKAAVEVRNQYLLRYQAQAPGTRVEISLKQPESLPVLKPVWKAPF